MQTKIKKWGNSLAVRVPKGIAEKAGIEMGDEFDIEVENDNIIILLPRKSGKYRLRELVKDITDENRHEETDFGGPVGREVW
jgi:antitoxin MazE